MERNIKIRLSKKFNLYGKISGSPTKPLFIVVHGLPGEMDEGFYENSIRWFAQYGYATFRFNFYGWQKDARQLMHCTLKRHAADLDIVIRYFRKKGFQKIFVAGHSYGGPAILLSKEQDFDAVALWDPSYQISFIKKRYGLPGGKYIETLDGYLMRWGVNVIIGRRMAKEAETLAWENIARNFHTPLKIIAAEKGVLVSGARHYFKTANNPKSFVIIKEATHYFNDREGTQEKVFKESESWFSGLR